MAVFSKSSNVLTIDTESNVVPDMADNVEIVEEDSAEDNLDLSANVFASSLNAESNYFSTDQKLSQDVLSQKIPKYSEEVEVDVSPIVRESVDEAPKPGPSSHGNTEK